MNPLHKLDSAILQQYEKVNQWAGTKFGIDKYQLGRACDYVCLASLVGAGTYSAIEAVQFQDPARTFVSITLFVGAKLINSNFKRDEQFSKFLDNQSKERYMPRPSPSRPLFMAWGIYEVAERVLRQVLDIPFDFPDETEGGIALRELAHYTLTPAILSMQSATYFRDCSPPSGDTKSLWKTLSEKASSVFRKEPELQPETSSNRSLEGLLQQPR